MQQDRADRRIVAGLAHGRRQLGDQRLVERVVDVGAREPDQRHAFTLEDLDRRPPARLRRGAGGRLLLRHARPYILNTPNRVGGIGRLSDAEIARASTRRVSAGSMTPSSHRRALA